MASIADRRREFRQLHERGCFALPNPHDPGSAKYLQLLGFKALATTSAGFAFSRGIPDGQVGRDLMLGHIREMVAAVDLPMNADFENGYADEPKDIAANVRLCLETGVAGLSIEDNSGRRDRPLYDLDLAVERIRAAKEEVGNGGVARQIEIIGQLEAELGSWRVKLFDTIQEREGFDARIRFLSRRLNAKIGVKFRDVQQEFRVRVWLLGGFIQHLDRVLRVLVLEIGQKQILVAGKRLR